MSDTDTRDRVIKLEADLVHTRAAVDKMALKVDAMHELMLQGRGAAKASKVLLVGLNGAVAFGAASLGITLPWSSK